MSHEVKGFWLDLYSPEMIDLDCSSPMYRDYRDFWGIVAEDLAPNERLKKVARAIANGVAEVSFNALVVADSEEDVDQEDYEEFLGAAADIIQRQNDLTDDEYEEAVKCGLRSIETKEWYGRQA